MLGFAKLAPRRDAGANFRPNSTRNEDDMSHFYTFIWTHERLPRLTNFCTKTEKSGSGFRFGPWPPASRRSCHEWRPCRSETHFENRHFGTEAGSLKNFGQSELRHNSKDDLFTFVKRFWRTSDWPKIFKELASGVHVMITIFCDFH
jgi:hypothetical protein